MATSTESSKQIFSCPRCGEKLSFLDGTVIKLEGVLRADHFSVRAQFFLSSRLGQYGVIVSGPVELREGARVEFCCPSPRCGADFTAAYDRDLAEIRMVDENRREYVVVFNKVYGRRSTFLVDYQERKLVSSFGDHAGQHEAAFERPLNFFGAV